MASRVLFKALSAEYMAREQDTRDLHLREKALYFLTTRRLDSPSFRLVSTATFIQERHWNTWNKMTGSKEGCRSKVQQAARKAFCRILWSFSFFGKFGLTGGVESSRGAIISVYLVASSY